MPNAPRPLATHDRSPNFSRQQKEDEGADAKGDEPADVRRLLLGLSHMKYRVVECTEDFCLKTCGSVCSIFPPRDLTNP